MLACVKCETEGCEACNGSGYHEFVGCPKAAISGDTANAVFAADMAREGVFPIGGGWAEQTHSAMHAIRTVWQIETMLANKGD